MAELPSRNSVPDSSPPPNIPDVRISRIRLKERAPQGQPSRSSPACTWVSHQFTAPYAQCLGGHRFRYALIPYAGHWGEARIWEPALELNVMLVGTQVKRSRGLLRSPAAFLSVDPPELLLSTVKLAEEDDALVLRLHNLTNRPQRGAVELFADISEAVEVNLNEEEQERLVLLSTRSFAIQAGPFQIKTVKVCLKKPSPVPGQR